MAFGRLVGPSVAARLFGGAPGPHLALLRATWAAVVGREIARRSEVISFDRRMLNVRVADVRWQKVLHRLEADIVARLAAVAGDLAPARLGFTQGPVADGAGDPATPPRTRPEAPAPKAVEAAAEAIADPELKAAFLRAARLYLEKKDNA